jgi:aspartate kinase
MPSLVMKFGGTSVANIERIKNVALHVKREVEAGYNVAVVVSAMSGKTNELVGWAKEAAPFYNEAEYDVVVAAGEQVTSGLLAITLNGMGIKARSMQGWQVPIETTSAHSLARISNIPPDNLEAAFKLGEVVVIAGFQGVDPLTNKVTTLGRGGSDTSAVAIAAAIKAERCDIYTDVDGVYTTDPRVVAKAKRLERIGFEEMLEMASMGSKVLQVRSVELSMIHKVRTFVRSSFDDPASITADNFTGTLICDEEEIMEQQTVTGIAFAKDEAQIAIRSVADRPGVAAAIFSPLAEGQINVDMIVQNVSADGKTDITFTCPEGDLPRALKILEGLKIDYAKIETATDVVKVSCIGIGMRSHAGVAAKAFAALADKGVNIRAITTSEIKFSVLIDQAYSELAVRTLHTLYGLDK